MIQIQLQRYDPHAALEMFGTAARFKPFGDDGLTFGDVIDVINPLHHIPVIGAIYRKLTGGTIDPAIRVAGGALFGGPIGAAFSVAAVVFGAAQKGSSDLAPVAEQGLAHNSAPPQLSKDAAAFPQPPTALRGGVIIGAANTGSYRQISVAAPADGSDPSHVNNYNARQIRRGGWMVVQAYGPIAPDRSAEPKSQRSDGVNIAV